MTGIETVGLVVGIGSFIATLYYGQRGMKSEGVDSQRLDSSADTSGCETCQRKE